VETGVNKDDGRNGRAGGANTEILLKKMLKNNKIEERQRKKSDGRTAAIKSF
jgi:hypothetical protein